MTRLVSRRDLLRGAGAALAGARLAGSALAASLAACGSSDSGPSAIARAYFGRNRGGAAVVGDAYRAWLVDAGVSVDDDLAPLVAELEQPGAGPELLDDLAAAVAAEFRATDVVRLGGWTFAPTELRLCALVSLAG